MYPNLSPSDETNSFVTPQPQRCVNCGVEPPVAGANKLCATCRQSFINFPIPKWIWAFAAGILVVMLFGFMRMGEFMSHSIHLAKAEKAMEEHKYVTAQKELQKVLTKFPNRDDINADMLIAAAYNHDDSTVRAVYAKIENASFEDQKVVGAVGEALDYYIVGDIDSAHGYMLLGALKDSAAGLEHIIPKIDTISDVPNRIGCYLFVANWFFEMNKYDRCKAMVDTILKVKPNNYIAITLSAAANRNSGKIAEAVSQLNQLLKINQEDVSVISQLSRTELKRSNDKQAADLAKKAMNIDPNNVYALESTSMVEYYAGRKEKSLQTLAKIKSIENGGDSTISTRLNKIISGQEKYR